MAAAAPALTRARPTLVALVVSSASAMLVAFNALVAALTCGDDGALDYGTGGAAARRYCRMSFDTHPDGIEHFSTPFTVVSFLTLAAVAVTGTALAITRKRVWLHGSVALLVALAAWTVAILVVVQ